MLRCHLDAVYLRVLGLTFMPITLPSSGKKLYQQ